MERYNAGALQYGNGRTRRQHDSARRWAVAANVMGDNGVVTVELLSDEAYVTTTLDGDLGSFPAGRRIGWGLHVDAGDDPAALRLFSVR